MGFCSHGKLWTRCEICKQEFIEKDKLAAYSSGRFSSDRNLAFKCNWMDTDYEKPCGKIGRRYNIFEVERTWCTQIDNECRRLEEGKTDIVTDEPCYECGIFSKLDFGAGIQQTEKNAGKGIHINNKMVGKLALFTTRNPNEGEDERKIFGFFRIKDFYSDPVSGATHVKGDREMTLKVPIDSRLDFWDFYRNKNTPKKVWSSLLFRYLSDETVLKFLQAQLNKLQLNGHKDELKIVEDVLKLYVAN